MDVTINNIGIFQNSLPEIKKAMLLITALEGLRDNLNVIRTPRKDILKTLPIKERQYRSWIKVLIKNDVIKYKTCGTIYLNPNFYFVGSADDFERAKKLWDKTTSHLAA